MKKKYYITALASIIAISVVFNLLPARAALNDSLTACWSMDETSGTRADSTSNALDLTDNNTVGSATGIISNAASFTAASSEWLSRAENPLLRGGASSSMSFWMYQPTSIADNRVIFNKWPNGFIVRTAGGGDDLLIVYGASADDSAQTTTVGMAADTWYHVVLIYDGGGSTNADKLKVYVNGSAHTLTFINAPPASISDSGADFNIGRWSTLGYYMEGRIDEFGFFQRAITSSEVAELYNSGAGIACPFASAPAPSAARRRSPNPIFIGL